MSLAVGEFATYDASASSGCLVFPANGGGTEAEYLLTMQIADGTPGAATTFVVEGAADAAPAAAPSFEEPPAAPTPRPLEFHAALRTLEATRFQALPPAPPGAYRAPLPPVAKTPPTVGEQRVFSVCAILSPACIRFDPVTAEARAVGTHLAIFIDVEAPPNGLNDEDLDTLIQTFDERLYDVNVAAFGGESDIDNNDVVIVLMTAVVNKLVSEEECNEDGFVVGFFVGADIDPLFADDDRVNHGEVFYSIVADPSGTLSCDHSRDQLKRIVPVTFIHEFQHMISYNEHVVLRDGEPETLWLGEAMSHYAEELGGESYLADGDPDTFDTFLLGNMFNAGKFLQDPHRIFLFPRTGIGSLAERGAVWLYLRHVIDQYAADTTLAARNTFTRRLNQTTNIGAVNVAVATGAPMTESVTRWAMANWADDLPGFTTPPELQYAFWDFRSAFAALNASNPQNFPLAWPLQPTVSPGTEAWKVGMMRSGAPVYHRAMQPVGAPSFTVRFGTGYLTVFDPELNVRVGVVRVR